MKNPRYRRGSVALALATAGWITMTVAATNLLSLKDTEFVTKAAQGGFAEVALGGIAVDRASNDMVRDFARRMVTDHGQTNEKLLAFANSKGLDLPDTLQAKHEQLKHQLQAAESGDFDRLYVQAMVKDHQEDVAEFERQARDAEDPDLRRLAEKTLPVLQSHLDAIRDIEESL